MAKDEKLEDVLYYIIEKTNKVIRRYSQMRFMEAGLDITVDQWLVLKKINDSERITQIELANALFKDRASITRTLDLLLKKKLVKREAGADKRSFELALTPTGARFLNDAMSIVKDVRRKGVDSMAAKDLEQLRNGLQKIIKNLE